MESLNWTGFYLEYYSAKLLKSYLKKCPTLFHLCYDPIGTHKRARTAIGFCLGFFMAICFYFIIIADLQFDTYTSLALGAMIIIMMSLGCAFSIQVNLFIARVSNYNCLFTPVKISCVINVSGSSLERFIKCRLKIIVIIEL